MLLLFKPCLLMLAACVAHCEGFSADFGHRTTICKFPNHRCPRISSRSHQRIPTTLCMSKSNVWRKIPKTARQWGSDFWFGATFVNNNFLETLSKILKTILQIVIPIILLFLAGAVWFPSPTNFFRVMVEKALMLVLVFSNLIQMLLAAPFWLYRIMDKLLNKRSAKSIFLYLSSFIHQQESGFSTVANLSYRSLLPQVLVSGPVREELIYRFAFGTLWKKMANRLGRTKANNGVSNSSEDTSETVLEVAHQPETSTKWLGYVPWMLVASLLFSVAHLGNHLPPPSSASIDETIGTLGETIGTRLKEINILDFDTKPFLFIGRFNLTFSPIFLCLFQALLTGIVSLHIFCPLYEQRGLMASIGAHCTWNLFGVAMFPLHLLVRLILKLFKSKASRKTEADNSDGSA
jgi:hypothetical protein